MATVLSSCDSGSNSNSNSGSNSSSIPNSDGTKFIGTWKEDNPNNQHYLIITEISKTEFLVVEENRNVVGLGDPITERYEQTYTLVDGRLDFFNGAAKLILSGQDIFNEREQKFIKQ